MEAAHRLSVKLAQNNMFGFLKASSGPPSEMEQFSPIYSLGEERSFCESSVDYNMEMQFKIRNSHSTEQRGSMSHQSTYSNISIRQPPRRRKNE